MASRFEISAIFTAIDKMTAPVRKMQTSTKGLSAGIKRDFASAQRQAENFGGSFKHILGPLTALISIGAITDFANESINKFRELQAAVANVQAGLVSTRGIAGLTLDQLTEMSENLSKNTIFGKKDILENATAQLLTFTGITKANFDRVQSVVADVTAKLKGVNATGEDLHSTSIMVGKAMEDPIKGLTAMRRIGISFSRDEEGVVKSMMDANNVIGAQNYMLKVIERQYGGTAAALAKTDEGMAILKRHKLDEAMERIGKKLSPLKTGMTTVFLAVMPAIEKFFDILVKIGNEIPNIIEAIKPFAQFLPIILSMVLAWQVYDKGLFAVAMAQKILNGVMKTSKFEILILIIGLLIGAIIYLRKNWEKLSPAMKFIVYYMGALIGAFLLFKTIQKGIAAVDVIKYLWMMRAAILKTIIAQWGLNAAFLANPVTWIVIGIMALIAIIILLIMNWDKVKRAFIIAGKAIWDVLKQFGAAMLLLLGPIGMIINIFKALYDHWDKIKKAFTSKGILAGLLEIGRAIMDGLLYPVQQLLQLLSKIPGVGDKIKPAVEWMKGFRENTLGATKSAEEAVKPIEKAAKPVEKVTKPTEKVTGKSVLPTILSTILPRALGGPVETGKSYMVGERGRELFTPDTSGYVKPMVTTQRESIIKAIETKITESRIVIENQSNNNVRSGDRPIKTGTSLKLVPSG